VGRGRASRLDYSETPFSQVAGHRAATERALAEAEHHQARHAQLQAEHAELQAEIATLEGPAATEPEPAEDTFDPGAGDGEHNLADGYHPTDAPHGMTGRMRNPTVAAPVKKEDEKAEVTASKKTVIGAARAKVGTPIARPPSAPTAPAAPAMRGRVALMRGCWGSSTSRRPPTC
jgi:hypothetical protein